MEMGTTHDWTTPADAAVEFARRTLVGQDPAGGSEIARNRITVSRER